MIRHCTQNEFDRILAIINEAAQAYRGIIPDDRWKDPYMPAEELADEIAAGVVFDGYEIAGTGLVGLMGVQTVEDVTLIRHAYVAPGHQRSGIGSSTAYRAVRAPGSSGPGRHLGCRRLGDCFLPAAWVQAGTGAGEVNTATTVLDHT